MPRHLKPIPDPLNTPNRSEAEAWMAARPPHIKKLAAEYPLGSVITDHKGDDWYVIGWGESTPCEHGQTDAIIISPIWCGGGNYDASIEARQYIHSHHIADGEASVRRAKP